MTSPERASLNAAIEAVAMNSTQWLPFAELAVREAATANDRLTSDHVWRILQRRGVPPPSEPRAMAPAMMRGVKRGWIVATDEYQTQESPATGRHPGPQRVYRSTIYGMDGPRWPALPAPNMKPIEVPPGYAGVIVGGAAVGIAKAPVLDLSTRTIRQEPDVPITDPVPRRLPTCPKPGCELQLGLIEEKLAGYVEGRCPTHGKQTVKWRPETS